MYSIQNIYIGPEAADSEAARRIHDLFPSEAIHDLSMQQPDNDADPKRNIILSINKGEFIKSCPCTQAYTGCGYTVLNYIHNCPLTCNYCILQAYLNEPAIRLYSNFDSIETELAENVWNRDNQLRIGTGELGDSLALEALCGYGQKLTELFAQKEHSILELKTKSTAIETILPINHRRRTVLAWSVNTPAMIAKEEQDTASLEERSAAAKAALEADYLIAFHCDPVLDHPDWKQGYAAMLDQLAAAVGSRSKQLVWFSIGGMRFMPALKRIVKSTHPDSLVTSGPFIAGLDGKQRYYRPVRTEMFKHIYDEAIKRFPHTAVYFCMESPEIWQDVTGRAMTTRDVSGMLDSKVF